jgi:hypothetical protein
MAKFQVNRHFWLTVVDLVDLLFYSMRENVVLKNVMEKAVMFHVPLLQTVR